MASSTIQLLTTLLVLISTSLISAAPTTNLQAHFGGALLLHDLFVSSPIQADPTSSFNGTLFVVVTDTDYPTLKPVRCHIEWLSGVTPPSSARHACENSTTRVWFPEDTFHGVGNFQLQFARTVIEPSIGPCPQYCLATKFASINITHPDTPGYNCDLEHAVCGLTTNGNATLSAEVFAVVA